MGEYILEAVARQAVLADGHKSLAVLYPDDAFGKTMLSLFEAEASRLGALVVAKEAYNFAEGTFKEAADKISCGKSGGGPPPATRPRSPSPQFTSPTPPPRSPR